MLTLYVIRKNWKRRFFTLDHGIMKYYETTEVSYFLSANTDSRQVHETTWQI
jgi:hypothetical protein